MITPGPWEHDDKFTVAIPIQIGEYEGTEYVFRLPRIEDARAVSLTPDLLASLEEVTDWLEGSDAYAMNHGAHSAAVEARKLLAKAKGETP